MYGSNLVGISPEWLGSIYYNADPARLSIPGVRARHASLFAQLDQQADPAECALLFQQEMDLWFGLHQLNHDKHGKRRFRSHYLSLLNGWAFDASSIEGAVLKGWVESRFGLQPCYHREPLGRFGSPSWMRYVEDKLNGRYLNNNMYMQLDLLYEFCQYMLWRQAQPGQRHITLYRGANSASLDCTEATQSATRPCKCHGPVTVHLNNLVSFTARHDIADGFGDLILTVKVPLSKILFFNRLLPGHRIKGEHEYLVIGGEFRAEVSYL